MQSTSTESSTQVVERVLKAIELLAARPATPDELADALDVHRRTVTRMLGTMESAGYVQRDPTIPQLYHLSFRIVTLAGMLLHRNDVVRIARPRVARLRDRTGEAAHLSVPAKRKVVHVIHEHSTNRLMVKAEAGDEALLHCSAVGKTLLAFRPDLLAQLAGTTLVRLTEKTITSSARLEQHLQETRERGYAVDDEEIEIGTRCVAAPVRDYAGEVIAALGISGPALRITPDRVEELAVMVREEADAVSALLGFGPPSGPERAGPDTGELPVVITTSPSLSGRV